MSDFPLTLRFHGAAKTVTGSCMEFTHAGRSLLVDCGLFQGSRTLERLNHAPFDFDAKRIDAVILTHAHLDHAGLLPKLVAEGFRGEIVCSEETRDLLEYMLADAGRIHESEAKRHNRRPDRAGEEPFKPIYTEVDAIAAWRLCRGVKLSEWIEPIAGFRVRLWNAGHILGSTSVELEAAHVRVMCSGDIGPENKAFQRAPAGPQGFDHVVCEATYGDRDREPVTKAARRKMLEAEVRAAQLRGGNLIIPAFALERTQELLLDLDFLLRSGALSDIQVFVDSPLASRITSVFATYSPMLSDTDGANVFDHPAFHFVAEPAESIRLNSVSGAVILSASGMCEAGRVRHHLLHNLARRESTILFVGYQAKGTLGRVILDGAKAVRISGSDIRVQAQIRRIDQYSAHADQAELLQWIGQRVPIGGSLFLDHGEPEGLETVRRELQRRMPGLTVKIPQLGETYGLAAEQPAKRIGVGDMELQEAVGQDWQNAYAEFTTTLKARLTSIRDNTRRRKALDEMRQVLESYTAAMDRDGTAHKAQKGLRRRA